MITYDDILEERRRIEPYVVRTPLLRLEGLDEALGCQVFVKAECMQRTGAFKLRGAMNKLLSMTKEQRANGVVAASSGNHGRAVAYGAKMLGCRATIVIPNSAPRIKVEAIKALGAEVVMCETPKRFEVAQEICDRRKAAILPPFNDELVMAGQGTAGLEILEQQPDLDAVVVPVSGGGLISGVSTAIKAASDHIKVCGAEPAALPRYTASLAAGKPVKIEQKPTVADALVTQIPGDICFPCVAKNVDGIADVEDEYILRATRLLLAEGKVLAEPSSCIGVGAVMQGALRFEKERKVCFLLSGGNVGLDQLQKIISNA